MFFKREGETGTILTLLPILNKNAIILLEIGQEAVSMFYFFACKLQLCTSFKIDFEVPV